MQNPPNIPLAVPVLRDLIYGAEDLESIKPTTKASGDTALVYIRPVYIGKLVSQYDEAEDIFHVEFASNMDRTWSEIWLAKEWRESNARCTRNKVASVERRKVTDIRAKRLDEVKQHLIGNGLDRKPGYVEHLAVSILDYWKQGKYNEILNILKLTEKLNQYEEEDKGNPVTAVVPNPPNQSTGEDFGQAGGSGVSAKDPNHDSQNPLR